MNDLAQKDFFLWKRAGVSGEPEPVNHLDHLSRDQPRDPQEIEQR
jgi:hypothetical protein